MQTIEGAGLEHIIHCLSLANLDFVRHADMVCEGVDTYEELRVL